MGDSQSTHTTTKILNDVSTSVVNSSTQACSQSNQLLNSVNISNMNAKDGCIIDFGNINMSTKNAPSMMCVGKAMNKSDIKADIANKVGAKIKQALQSSVFKKTSQSDTTNTEITNNIKTAIKNIDMQKCMQKNFLNNKINLSGWTCSGKGTKINLGNINSVIKNKAVMKCFKENANFTAAATKFDNVAKKAVDQEKTPFFMPTGMSGWIKLIVMAIIVIAVIGGGIYAAMNYL